VNRDSVEVADGWLADGAAIPLALRQGSLGSPPELKVNALVARSLRDCNFVSERGEHRSNEAFKFHRIKSVDVG